jgi:hypothetical protein
MLDWPGKGFPKCLIYLDLRDTPWHPGCNPSIRVHAVKFMQARRT